MTRPINVTQRFNLCWIIETDTISIHLHDLHWTKTCKTNRRKCTLESPDIYMRYTYRICTQRWSGDSTWPGGDTVGEYGVKISRTTIGLTMNLTNKTQRNNYLDVITNHFQWCRVVMNSLCSWKFPQFIVKSHVCSITAIGYRLKSIIL